MTFLAHSAWHNSYKKNTLGKTTTNAEQHAVLKLLWFCCSFLEMIMFVCVYHTQSVHQWVSFVCASRLQHLARRWLNKAQRRSLAHPADLDTLLRFSLLPPSAVITTHTPPPPPSPPHPLAHWTALIFWYWSPLICGTVCQWSGSPAAFDLVSLRADQKRGGRRPGFVLNDLRLIRYLRVSDEGPDLCAAAFYIFRVKLFVPITSCTEPDWIVQSETEGWQHAELSLHWFWSHFINGGRKQKGQRKLREK